MSEEEYWNSEPDNNDEIDGDYLADETDDITLVLLPKMTIDIEDVIEKFYKVIKKCRTKDQVCNVLGEFYTYTSTMTLLDHEAKHLQERAKDLELNIKVLEMI